MAASGRLSRLATRIASLGGIGFLPIAPGTWGSAAVLPVALLGPQAALLLAVLLTAAAAWALPRVLPKNADPGWVVIDEGAGQALALAALPLGTGWLGVALAFALFRLFDIAKPGPVGWADRQPGAFGVLLDDLIAGALAAAGLLVIDAVGIAL